MLRLIERFWDVVVLGFGCQADWYHKASFKAYHRVMQGGTFSTIISNMMVIKIVREWFCQVLGTWR